MDKNVQIESLEFLNMKVYHAYDRKHHFVENGKKFAEFKNSLLTFIQQIERVYRSIYLSDISLDISQIDVEIFKRQYPTLYEKIGNKTYVIYNREGEREKINGISYITWFMERIRNINMHAVNNLRQYEFIIDPEFIKEIPPLADNVNLVIDDELTIMGMIVLIFVLLDKKSTGAERYSYASKIANTWGKFIWGDEDGCSFGRNKWKFANYFADNFANDFEIDIRQNEEETDILKAIFGNQYNKVSINEEMGKTRFHIELANTRVEGYGCSGIIQRQGAELILVIEKGSYCGMYFNNSYELKIKDEQEFIKMSCKVPPFMAVAYLYATGITAYDKYSLSEKQTTMFLKLNKPKFYKDKGLTILLASDKEADLRDMGKGIASNLLGLFLSLEEKILFVEEYKQITKYSKLNLLLEEIECPKVLANKMVTLRNFAAHSYLLNEYVINQYAYKITLDFIFGTIQEFLDFLKEKYNSDSKFDYYQFFKARTRVYLWNATDGSKYKRIFANSFNLFDKYKVNKGLSDLLKALELNFGVIENSIITPEIEEKYFAEKYNYFFSFHAKEIPSLRQTEYEFRSLTKIELHFDSSFEIYGQKANVRKIKMLYTNDRYLNAITIDNMPVKFILIDEQRKGLVIEKKYKVEKA